MAGLLAKRGSPNCARRAALVLTATFGVIAGTQCTIEPAPVATSDVTTSRPAPSTSASTLERLSVLEFEGSGTDIAADLTGAWVVGLPNEAGAEVLHVRDGTVDVEARVGISPTAIVVDDHEMVWVANGSGVATVYGNLDTGPGFPSEHSITQLDRSGETKLTVNAMNPSGLIFGHGSVWAIVDDGVMRVDSGTGQVEAFNDVQGMTDGYIGADDKYVWLMSAGYQARLVRIDPATNTASEFATTDGCCGMAFSGSFLWTYSAEGLIAMDPENASTAVQISGKYAFGLTASSAGVWVVDSDYVVYLLDSDGTTLASSHKLAAQPLAGSALGDEAWFVGEERISHVSLVP